MSALRRSDTENRQVGPHGSGGSSKDGNGDTSFQWSQFTTQCSHLSFPNRGGEYISQEFKDYLKACGIIQQLTPPYTPQHNGVSERRNRTLLDMVRSVMNLTTLPLSFWDYALESATRILNMVPTKKVDKNPYELWYGKVLNMSYLKVWGCEALVKRDTPDKLQQRFVKCIFIGYLKETMDKSKRLIGLGQNAYMDKILKRYKIDNSKRGHIPMQERLDLNKTQGASTPKEVKRMQNVPYASAVGSIMYAVRCTRPDVAFAQNITSRFQQNPGESHWTAVKNILKYLRNTKDMFLTGYVFILNGVAVDWKSSKQSTTAISATEAEYIAASKAAMKAVWIRKFISGIVHRGARHYHKRYHYVRESIALGEIRFLKVHKDENLADPFTKALSKGKLTQHARSMGLRAIYRTKVCTKVVCAGAIYLAKEIEDYLYQKKLHEPLAEAKPTGMKAEDWAC
ncbi:retrotransposon protein, putative, ty1-copia subclass [Tanacetum coccineum]|uniref:Retrotransposon protein, putative, ty1-copia subclass n=1 Tax=Tanacetum coccineum TaxID=301880 RepID=A0ABQ4YPL1_9ASTR